MGLDDGDNFVDHFILGDIVFGEGVEGKIFIEPDSAESLFVNGDHGAHNLKAAKSVVESFKAEHGLFE